MKKRITEGLGIAGLIINILIPPAGIGSIVCGRLRDGLMQIVMSLIGYILIIVGLLLSIFLVGIPILILGIILVFFAWLWAIFTSALVLSN